MPRPDRVQVLALDGGGLRGLFSAHILACLERDLGVTIRDHFDLITGTSAGGLIALALGSGIAPSDVVDAVLRYDRDRGDITQDQLRDLNRALLRRYVAARQAEGHPLAPRGLEPKRRAVALLYDDPFHLDVLPVIPDLDAYASIGDPSLLTDRELTRWQSTNPRVRGVVRPTEPTGTGAPALYRWLRKLASDLDVLHGARGIDQVADVADSILGEGSGQRIARRLAAKVQEARTAGRLASTSTGALAIGGASAHRAHTFYGAAAR